ncbi:MAG: winged helix-turn-helix transcriptional regulator [Sphingobacteriales bacterium]
MALPIPGGPVRGSKSGQPIMALFDLLGRNWAMGIIWNLNDGACTFRELQSRCETVSPTTLNIRLKELTESFIIERTMDGYALTTFGRELFELLQPIGKLAKNWSKKFKK